MAGSADGGGSGGASGGAGGGSAGALIAGATSERALDMLQVERSRAADEAIATRANQHLDAYLEAKRPALDAIAPGDIDARRDELNRRDIEIVTVKTAQQWARLDATDFRKIDDASMREDSALAMAANASGRYHQALREVAPDVADSVQAYADVANRRAIEARNYELMPVPKDELPQADASQLVREDLAAFRAIDNPMERRNASVALGHNADSQAQYKAELVKQDPRAAEVINAQAQKWAEVDARDFRKLQEQGRQEDAAVVMAEVARNSPAYRAALAEKSPDVADRVQTLDAEASAREGAKSDRKRGLTATIDTAAPRANDNKQAADEMGLNSIEPAIERQQQRKLEADNDAKRGPEVPKAEAAQLEQPKAATTRGPGGNQVGSDEVFTAPKSESKPIVPAEVEQKYVRVGDKYYHPKNTDVVAFEDKGNKLETRSNSEQVAETMVTIARARGWDEIKVSGSETFRKEVWLEAAAHGMHVKGYTPTEIDKAELAKRIRDIEANKVEPDAKFRARETGAEAANQHQALAKPAETTRGAQDLPADAERDRAAQLAKDRAQAFATKPPAEAVKEHPELAGTYAAMASMEKKAQADNLTLQQQAVVLGRIKQNIVNSIERGELPQVQVREQIELKREVEQEREMSR